MTTTSNITTLAELLTDQDDTVLRQILRKLTVEDGLDPQTAHNVLGDSLVTYMKECNEANALPVALSILNIMDRAEAILREEK